MTALSPIPNGTAGTTPIVLPAPPVRRRAADVAASEVPSWGFLVAALGSAGVALIAVAFALAGVLWVALPFGAAAVAIFAGVWLPDAYGRRLDRARAVQEEAGA